MRLTLFGVRLGALLDFYRYRFRSYAIQELFAGVGIAIGVALVFAAQVANTSITASAERLVHGITGAASLQLAARSSEGFDERLAEEAQRLPEVRHAAPLLRARVALSGPRGERWVELLGGTPDLAALGGDLLRNFGAGGLALRGSVALPEKLADAIGVGPGAPMRVYASGRSRVVRVGVVLEPAVAGVVAHSKVAVAPLEIVQALAGKPHRLSQLIIEPQPGAEDELRRELTRLAGGRAGVEPADAELALLEQAAKPNEQSTALFAGISAMVGFLFALNAMLATGPKRRRLVADLRVQGYLRRQVVLMICFEAALLGVGASLVGLALGDLLSRVVFDETPAYLTIAFPVSGQRVVEPAAVAIAFGGGVLAALAASLRPLLDMRSGRPLDAVFREVGEPGESVSPTAARGLLIAGLVVIVVTTIVVSLVPDATVVGALALAVATVLVMPACFAWSLRRVERATGGSRRFALVGFAMREMQGARTRSMTLAAVGALAVYGSVTIGGAHSDLLRGLELNFQEQVGNADLWVTNVGDALTTTSFEPGDAKQLATVAGVAAVRTYRGGLFDIGGRRIYVTGRPQDDRTIIPSTQLVEGDLARAARLIRAGGWVTVSDELARSQGLGLGDRLAVPGHVGVRTFRIAALTTNLGWPPGAVIMNGADYQRTWNIADPTALEVLARPGAAPLAIKRRIQAELGPRSPLDVRTQDQRMEDYRGVERQGLVRLSQITTLLLVAAALAMASAMSAAIWERRQRFAALKIQGFDRRQLWRALLCETGLVVGVASLLGILLGSYGHVLAGRYLKLATGFPAPFALALEQLLLALVLVAGIAYLVISLPGRAAVRTPMSTSLRG